MDNAYAVAELVALSSTPEERREALRFVQDELARSILEHLPLEVSQAEMASVAQRFTRDVAA